jgi:D-3-phosphoglycerate dehydrogenase
MTTVLVSAPYIIPIIDRFRIFLESYSLELIIAEVSERLSEGELLAYAGKFDGALSGDDKFTPRVLEACAPRLKVISKWGTGIDSIDQEAAARLGIKIFRTPNAFTAPVADSVLGYILAFSRRLPWMDRSMKSGEWNKIPGFTLSERTLGVVGVGRIGKAIIRRALVFGMKMMGNDIVEIDPDFVVEHRVRMTTLDDLLKGSDFVSLNCDLNPTSYHLINRRTLSMMKPGAVLINTSRGPIIDEPALIEALQNGTIGGAALDVFEAEPIYKDNPLLELENVLLAPHNANSSPAAWERVHWNTIRNLLIGLGFTPPQENPC